MIRLDEIRCLITCKRDEVNLSQTTGLKISETIYMLKEISVYWEIAVNDGLPFACPLTLNKATEVSKNIRTDFGCLWIQPKDL